VLWDFFAGMEVNEIARKEGITHQKVSTHRQRICTRAARVGRKFVSIERENVTDQVTGM